MNDTVSNGIFLTVHVSYVSNTCHGDIYSGSQSKRIVSSADKLSHLSCFKLAWHKCLVANCVDWIEFPGDTDIWVAIDSLNQCLFVQGHALLNDDKSNIDSNKKNIDGQEWRIIAVDTPDKGKFHFIVKFTEDSGILWMTI